MLWYRHRQLRYRSSVTKRGSQRAGQPVDVEPAPVAGAFTRRWERPRSKLGHTAGPIARATFTSARRPAKTGADSVQRHLTDDEILKELEPVAEEGLNHHLK